MKLTPYLAFDGNAAEALAYYCQAFGAEMVFSTTFAEMPEQEDWITDANKDRLAHGEITLNGMRIYASDTAEFEPHTGFAGVTLHLGFETADKARAMFETIAKDGTIKMPFAETFWSKGFGVVDDKFGVSWMVDVEEEGGENAP
jgi:PhnB protein